MHTPGDANSCLAQGSVCALRSQRRESWESRYTVRSCKHKSPKIYSTDMSRLEEPEFSDAGIIRKKSAKKEQKKQPRMRFELMTACLQDKRSTTELTRPLRTRVEAIIEHIDVVMGSSWRRLAD